MESLKSYYVDLEKLRTQATKLAKDASSLASIFAEEANRLHREEEVLQLEALRSSIMDRLKQERRLEDALSVGHSETSLTISAGRLATGIAIKLISKNKQLTAFSDSLLKKPSDKQPPFGNVFVCIGPKGMPDDAGVVSVSKLARESNRAESQVVNDFIELGCLLLSGEAFFLLTAKLINDVKEGRLLLPISLEKLS